LARSPGSPGSGGKALTKLGRHDEAEASLNEALAACLAQGRNHLTWRVTASLAALALKRGEAGKAAEIAEQGRRLIEERAATLPEGALRDRFQARALALVPGLRKTEAMPQRALGLTAREQEVAGLVARGLSNRAIAETLVLSERTVETHVANALSKLSFSSRSRLAVWASEKGLANAG
jgi:DNA-binding CsgD family transcriptional regulator